MAPTQPQNIGSELFLEKPLAVALSSSRFDGKLISKSGQLKTALINNSRTTYVDDLLQGYIKRRVIDACTKAKINLTLLAGSKH